MSAPPAVAPLRSTPRIDRLWFAGSAALYAFVLQIVYTSLVSPPFSYLGYTSKSIHLVLALITTAIATIPALTFIKLTLRRPTDLFLWSMYFVLIIPLVVLTPYASAQSGLNQVGMAAVAMLSYWLITVLLSAFSRLKTPSRLPVPAPMFWTFIGALSIINLSITLQSSGLDLDLSLFLRPLSPEIYLARSEAIESFQSSSALAGYALSWQANVVNPLFVSYGMLSGKRALVGLGLFLQIVAFAMAGSKSVLVTSVLIGAGIWIMRTERRHRALQTVVIGFVALLFIPAVLQSITGDISVSSIAIRRTLVTPALVTDDYFDFFNENPKALLGHSVLAGVVDYPFDEPHALIIGREHVSEDASANGSLIADAFANFGYLGVLLFSIATALALSYFDRCSRVVGQEMSAAILIGPGLALMSSGLLTTIFTHGFALALLVLFVMPREVAGRGARVVRSR